MKSLKTKFVVISAIGLASVVGIFVFAQSPVPSASGQDLPVLLVMGCTKVDHRKLEAALSPLPKNTYRFKYENEPQVGTLPDPSAMPPACFARFTGNATQKAKFANTQDLRKFLDTAGL